MTGSSDKQGSTEQADSHKCEVMKVGKMVRWERQEQVQDDKHLHEEDEAVTLIYMY